MPITPNRPVIQMDLKGKLIKEFPSVKKAAQAFGGTAKAKDRILTACKLRHNDGSKSHSNIAYEFIWKFKETI